MSVATAKKSVLVRSGAPVSVRIHSKATGASFDIVAVVANADEDDATPCRRVGA